MLEWERESWGLVNGVNFKAIEENYDVLVGVNIVRLIDVEVWIVVPAVALMMDVSVTSGRRNCEQKAETSRVTFSGLSSW
jgi:hypothetical protein